MSPKRRAELLLILTTMIWGGTFSAIKNGLGEASPLILMGSRFALAALCFSLVFPRIWRNLNRRSLTGGLILGILMFLGYGLQTLGLKETTASRSGFITYTFALYTPFLQFLILKRKPALKNLIGLGIVFSGLFLISRPGGGPVGRGDILTLGGALATAFYVIFLDIIARKHDTFLLTALQFIVCAAMSFLLAPLTETPYIRWTPNLIGSLLYLALLGSVVAIALMTRFQKDLTPTRAVLLYALEPLFALLFAALLLGERLSFPEAAGCGLILAGVVYSELSPEKKRKSPVIS